MADLGSGTVLPGSANNGDTFYKTDINTEYIYESGAWARMGGNPGEGGAAGENNTAVTAASAASTIKAGTGRIASILVTSLGAAIDTFTDGVGGPVIAEIPSGAPIGTEIKVDREFVASLYHVGGAGTPAFTISFD